jgi:hypothetical protein
MYNCNIQKISKEVRQYIIQDLVRRQFSLVPDNRTNVDVEACRPKEKVQKDKQRLTKHTGSTCKTNTWEITHKTCATSGAGTAYPFRTSAFTPVLVGFMLLDQ